MKQFKNQTILRANVIDKHLTKFTEECLKAIAHRSNDIKITKEYTKEKIGFANEFKYKNGELRCDLYIQDKLIKDRPVELYPCVWLRADLHDEIKGKKPHKIIRKSSLITIGMCDRHADDQIKPIKFSKLKVKRRPITK